MEAGNMPDTLADIQACLLTVQRTIDALNERGDNQAAFDLAKAQYSASIRTSWPATLAGLATLLERVCADAGLKLTAEERQAAQDAAATLRASFNH
jgi:hypothetical protein